MIKYYNIILCMFARIARNRYTAAGDNKNQYPVYCLIVVKMF